MSRFGRGLTRSGVTRGLGQQNRITNMVEQRAQETPASALAARDVQRGEDEGNRVRGAQNIAFQQGLNALGQARNQPQRLQQSADQLRAQAGRIRSDFEADASRTLETLDRDFDRFSGAQVESATAQVDQEISRIRSDPNLTPEQRRLLEQETRSVRQQQVSQTLTGAEAGFRQERTATQQRIAEARTANNRAVTEALLGAEQAEQAAAQAAQFNAQGYSNLAQVVSEVPVVSAFDTFAALTFFNEQTSQRTVTQGVTVEGPGRYRQTLNVRDTVPGLPSSFGGFI